MRSRVRFSVLAYERHQAAAPIQVMTDRKMSARCETIVCHTTLQ
jgi:hypothetical protein